MPEDSSACDTSILSSLLLSTYFVFGNVVFSQWLRRKSKAMTVIKHSEGGENERNMNSKKAVNEKAINIKMEKSKVVVHVPATSANLGPGFDVIGMALDMWSEYTVERSESFEVICTGEGCQDMPLDQTNLVCLAVAAVFQKANQPLPVLKYTLHNRIPYARGLGSSSAAIVGGLIAGLVLAGHDMNSWGMDDLLHMAAEIEGHPDNVAPALYGGIQLGIHTGTRWIRERVHLPVGLRCVCFIPSSLGKTTTARAVLPALVPRTEAVFNISRIAWLVNALASNNLDALSYGVQDALHQPQRAAAVYPYLQRLLLAAVDNGGAKAAYLSGAGPTVMALTSGVEGVDEEVAEAMTTAAEEYGLEGKVVITRPVSQGAYVVSATV